MTDDARVTLYLAAPTIEGIARLIELFTGRALSAEGRARLHEALDEETTE